MKNCGITLKEGEIRLEVDKEFYLQIFKYQDKVKFGQMFT